MAKNKVVFGDTTIMDITDTTAEAADVALGKVFYGNDGVRRSGTGNYMDKVSDPTADDILVTDANGQAVDSGVSLDDVDKVLVAVYEQTPYADVKAAIDAHKAIVLDMPANNNQFCITFATYTNGGNALMYAIYKMNDNPTLMTVTLTPQNQWTTIHTDLQDNLISGTNIKTINNQSLLGPGNIDIQGGESDVFVAEYFVTTKDELVQAYQEGKIIFVKSSDLILSASIEQVTPNWVDINVNESKGNASLKCTLYRVTASGWNFSSQQVSTTPDISMSGSSTNSVQNKVIKTYVDGKTAQATENALGTVKLNPSQNIDLNANGQLIVGGRIGQFEGTTGLFAPNDRQPRHVADYDLLVTDALGMNMTGDRSLAVVSGLAVTCKSAAAGSTEYRVTNNYNNRILCKLAEGGFASRDEATSKTEQIVQVTSVTINGSSFTPDSSANSNTDIVIKTAQTLNPSSAITSIRLFGTMGSYASIHTGNGIKSESGGRNLLLGGGVIKSGSSNDNALVGNGIFSTGNGVAAFGRYHILRKNRGFFAGTGHDSTNAPSEGASAIGQYSFMDANTLFAVGVGSSHTDRKNALEVRSDGIVLRSPNGTRYKLAVDDSGNLTTSPV